MTKAEASKIKSGEFFNGSKKKSQIISICLFCTSLNKYVVCVLSSLSPKQMFLTAVCNYTHLIVVIIK